MIVNMQEDILRLQHYEVLDELLMDKTTGGRILWATDAYEHLGAEFRRDHTIDGGSITVTKCYEGLEGGHVLIRSGGRYVLLAADAAFSPRNWREDLTPGFGFDREFQRKSLSWLREMEADPACAAILCSHDPALQPGELTF